MVRASLACASLARASFCVGVSRSCEFFACETRVCEFGACEFGACEFGACEFGVRAPCDRSGHRDSSVLVSATMPRGVASIRDVWEHTETPRLGDAAVSHGAEDGRGVGGGGGGRGSRGLPGTSGGASADLRGSGDLRTPPEVLSPGGGGRSEGGRAGPDLNAVLQDFGLCFRTLAGMLSPVGGGSARDSERCDLIKDRESGMR